MIKEYHRNIDRLANSELSQQGVTQAVTDNISIIKDAAATFAAKGGSDLVEGMKAVIDVLSNR